MTRRATTGRVDECKIVDVIRIKFIRGHGVEDDPVRVVTQWREQTGTLLFEHDPDAAPKAPERVPRETLDALAAHAREWRAAATSLRSEVEHGVTVRQSAEAKLARAEVLESHADQITSLLIEALKAKP